MTIHVRLLSHGVYNDFWLWQVKDDSGKVVSQGKHYGYSWVALRKAKRARRKAKKGIFFEASA
jgi:hypothetical protein